MYKVGDKVVYPHHGAGTVVKKEVREVLGQKREYLTIKIAHNDMVVNVPTENAERVGLRRVINEKMVIEVVKALTGSGTQMPKNWNRRFKHNRDKMKTGDMFELAEVVRNLSLRDHEKGLSTGEKQMFVKAKKILASELMYAKQMDEDKTHSLARRRPLRRGQEREASSEAKGQRQRVGTRASDEHLGGPRRSRSRRAARPGRPQGIRRASAGRPLLAESLERLEASDWIDAIVVVVPEGWEEPAILLAEELGAGKVAQAVAGGPTRAESVRLGVAEVPDDAVAVLVHDAARPLVSDEVVERVLAALGEGWDGAVPGLPVADTVKRVEGDAVVETLSARRARRRADAAGVRRAVLRAALRGRRRGRDRLRVARRGTRRPREGRRGRPTAAQGHDGRRPRPRRALLGESAPA